jgi:hypothetical protein
MIMNFFFTHPFILLVVGFGLTALLLAWFIFDIHRKWNRIFGTRARKDTDALAEVLEQLAAVEKNIRKLGEQVNELEGIGAVAIQKVGFKRFNPFEHTGGDQSFAVALLDRKNNGVIISSLYTRDGVRVYAKRMEAGASKHPLSAEEHEVLQQAIDGNHKS